ncbi:unnamed protein product [Lactuca saligna]|uniref:SWIM-type domain-containing protein n=1 Tax=Lactuca saligna TaxID=75948 RepID=A0AA35V6K1_LACSI|nr:unnamed protein product [Lactuca saligna]
MASSPNPTDQNFIVVDFHYNGQFAPNPLVYFDPNRASVRDVDFSGFGYEQFMEFLHKLTNSRSKDIYFCLPQESLGLGIHTLVNNGDYKEFLDLAYANDKRMNVYVDHHNEPIFDWIEAEESESENEDLDEDEDSVIQDSYSVDHEEDDATYPFPANKTARDRFLNILCEPIESEDQDDEYVPPQYPVYDERQPWDQMKPIIGMRFSNPTELKHMLSNYAVANGYDLWFEKNDSDRLLVKCCKKNKSPSCPFRLWASWMGKEKTFQIKSLVNEHNCCRVFKFGSIVTYRWIGKHFMSQIIENPKMSARKMKAKVSTTFNINVSVGQCRNAKKFALQEIEGSLIEHYGRLWSYGEEIIRSNPGSTVRLDVDIMPDSTTLFSKFYVCFKAVRDGWLEGCRPVIGLDGCFLKGIVRGEVISAVGRDANNHIYPLAWAVVCVENKETWKWFIDLLMDDINGGLGAGITLLSDGHKGLLQAVKENVQKLNIDNVLDTFWPILIKDRDPTTWSKAFFQEGRDCDAVENGVSESFNSAIRHARRRPIITMLEEIRLFVMERIYTQRVEGMEWDLLICPTIRKRIEHLKVKQRLWGVTPCGYQKYEVRFTDVAYGVDLIAKKCACRIWQLTGIPCLHGVAAISYLNHDAEAYVSQSYTTEAYLKCYKYSINPLNSSEMWPDVPYHKPLPPKRRRLPGRPSVKRKRDAIERELSGSSRQTVSRRGSIIKCGICKEPGHNKKKCPSNQQSNTSVPSSSRGSGADPSLSRGNEGPPPPPPPPAAQQPPPPPPAAPMPRRRVPVSRSGRRKYSERIIKQALRRQIPGVGSNADNPSVID